LPFASHYLKFKWVSTLEETNPGSSDGSSMVREEEEEEKQRKLGRR
jgi:hypothetical protein